MAENPAYLSDRNLFTTALLLAGWAPGRIARLFERAGEGPTTWMGMADDKRQARQRGLSDKEIATLSAVRDYMGTLGTENLSKVLAASGIPDATAREIISEAQGGQAATPTLRRVLDVAGRRLGRPLLQSVTTSLAAAGADESALDTTRTQYKNPGAAPPAPAAAPPASRPGKVWSEVAKPPKPGQPPAGAVPGAGGGDFAPPGTALPAAAPTPTTTPVEKPLTPDERRARIESMYGWAAALADDPEIAGILNDVANGKISETKADQLYKSSNFYKTYNSAAREWRIMERANPVDAGVKRKENLGIILDLARTMGITEPDMGRMERLNDFVLSTGISDRDVKRMLASEVRYDPTGAKTGISAQLKNIAREWLVPLSDQAMTAWVAGVAGGTKSTEDFTEYLRGMAKSMFPALGTALDDPNLTTRKYMDPYAQDTAKLLGVNPADIDWMDPKYMRAFNQVDPKTNQRTVMSRSDWQRTLMKDPTYKYNETAHGKQQKQALTTGLMEMFGFKFS